MTTMHERPFIQRLSVLVVAGAVLVAPFLFPSAALADGFTVGASPSSISVCNTGSNTSAITASVTGSTFATPPPANPVFSPSNIITLTPGSGNGYSNGNKNYAGTATATGTAIGTVSFTWTDLKGQTNVQNGSPLTLTVTDPFNVSPSTLTFNTSASQPLMATASGTGCSGITVKNIAFSNNTSNANFTMSPSCANPCAIALPQTFTVTPVNASTGTITFTDSVGGTAAVTITINAGTLSLAWSGTNTGQFAGTGAASQTLTATETNYTGPLTATIVTTQASPGPVASVSPGSTPGPGGTADFSVAPQHIGNGSIKVTDNHGGSQSLPIAVNGGTIAISGATIASFSSNDNTTASLAANAINVQGVLQTTSSGTGQVTLTPPGNINGSKNAGGNDVLPITDLSYTCSDVASSGTPRSFPTSPIALQANTQSGSCASFTGGSTFYFLDFNLNMLLDARALPADTFTSSANAFVITLSAT